MACRVFDNKPLAEPMLTSCQLDSQEHTSVEIESRSKENDGLYLIQRKWNRPLKSPGAVNLCDCRPQFAWQL